jgi:hypothetical protein
LAGGPLKCSTHGAGTNPKPLFKGLFLGLIGRFDFIVPKPFFSSISILISGLTQFADTLGELS